MEGGRKVWGRERAMIFSIITSSKFCLSVCLKLFELRPHMLCRHIPFWNQDDPRTENLSLYFGAEGPILDICGRVFNCEWAGGSVSAGQSTAINAGCYTMMMIPGLKVCPFLWVRGSVLALQLTLTVLVTTINAQWEGVWDVWSARYGPALLPPCPTIRVLS